jgi:hypothetical protein
MSMVKKSAIFVMLCTVCAIDGESFTISKTSVATKPASKKISPEDVLHQSGVTLTAIANAMESLLHLQKTIIEMSEHCAESGNANKRSTMHGCLVSTESDMDEYMLRIESTIATFEKNA